MQEIQLEVGTIQPFSSHFCVIVFVKFYKCFQDSKTVFAAMFVGTCLYTYMSLSVLILICILLYFLPITHL